MTGARTIAILAGGLSHERDVSLRSGRRVARSLHDLGHQVQILDVDTNLLKSLVALRPDCVIPLLHGAEGEDGSLRDVLEALRLPYVGSTPGPCRLAFDKMVAKARLAEAIEGMSPAVALPHKTFRDLGAAAVQQALVEHVGLPLVVKPTAGGSALGVSVVRAASEVSSALVNAFAYGSSAMLEQLAEGTEVSVIVVEDSSGTPVALPAIEIRPDADHYDFASRYSAGATEFFIPARLNGDDTAKCASLALTAHRTLGLRHLSRADLIVQADGRVVLIEVCVSPGCTETSLLPMAVEASGRTVAGVFENLVELAIGSSAK